MSVRNRGLIGLSPASLLGVVVVVGLLASVACLAGCQADTGDG